MLREAIMITGKDSINAEMLNGRCRIYASRNGLLRAERRDMGECRGNRKQTDV